MASPPSVKLVTCSSRAAPAAAQLTPFPRIVPDCVTTTRSTRPGAPDARSPAMTLAPPSTITDRTPAWCSRSQASRRHTRPRPSARQRRTTAPAASSAARRVASGPLSASALHSTSNGARPPAARCVSRRQSGGRRSSLSSTTGRGEGPAPGALASSLGSSASTVPRPTRMASTEPLRWCVRVMEASPLSATGRPWEPPPGSARTPAMKPSMELAKLRSV
mmetsp:Transcript_35280/g.112227  ORF Transcript_35280/g.112227 Transcript_35280/m.112227 type:complete len:220 (+) Transcript_35280:287-946(+)